MKTTRADAVGWMIGLAGLITISVSNIGAQEVTLDVSHRARAVHPGEVIVMEVRPSGPLVTIRATAFGATIRFFPSGEDGVWRGLVGIDLAMSPGEYPVAVRATTDGGDTVRNTYTLNVDPKEFPTRHLSVNPSFVTPPAEALERIQREARKVAAIFRAASGERQWQGGFPRQCRVRRRAVSDGEASSTVRRAARTAGRTSERAMEHP